MSVHVCLPKPSEPCTKNDELYCIWSTPQQLWLKQTHTHPYACVFIHSIHIHPIHTHTTHWHTHMHECTYMQHHTQHNTHNNNLSIHWAHSKCAINISHFIWKKYKGSREDVRLGEKVEPYYRELGLPNLKGWYLNKTEESFWITECHKGQLTVVSLW